MLENVVNTGDYIYIPIFIDQTTVSRDFEFLQMQTQRSKPTKNGQESQRLKRSPESLHPDTVGLVGLLCMA